MWIFSDPKILIAIIFWLIWFILYLFKNKNNEKDYDSLKLLQEHIINLNRTIDFKINQTNKIIDDKLNESNKLLTENMSKTFETSSKINEESKNAIIDITKKLTSLEETNKQIKEIWIWLEWIESILKNTKQRWILWEYFLETVLKNILPPENYSLQYKFKDGEIVDAVVIIKDKIIPIDSKFSLENYNKIVESKTKEEKEKNQKEFKNDLKKRIDETSKYIKPQEWTMDFAFMFIPSEWIYYDLLINKIWNIKINTNDLIEYAFKEKKVIIVSPTSFYAYLQTVLQWLRAMKIEEIAKDIQKNVWKLWKHLNAYESFLNKLWTSLSTSVNHFNNAQKEFNKIDKDIIKIVEPENKNLVLIESEEEIIN